MTGAATIPVTVVSGYLGAGKTTLVNHVLETTERRVAVLVNDMGEVNVDADLVARESESEGIVDLSNGCICCELRGDLVDAVEGLAESRAFDYLLVESSGISEPVPVAKTFLGDELSEFRLDTLVSVIDAAQFDAAFGDGDLPERDERVDAEGRHPTEVMVDQVECCDILLLNKRDRLSPDAMERVESIVSRLAPRAEIVRTEFSEVDPDRILDTGRFDLAEMQRSAGWKRELVHAREHGEGDEPEHDHSPATEFGVESFVVRYREPFHPGRLDEAFSEFADHPEIIRAKGVFLVAGREEEVMGFSQAGDAVRAGPIGRWDPERDDPRSELVFIGRGIDEVAVRERLEGCLAGEDEREVPRTADPFPR
ncbi:CobW family GTP-binding protein [Natronorarus salvus]|uniref:CobW family GTP-binding protein n=1 Tax=Natronorarus salvus TaxID=3117733 RepID=UPI002F263AB5